MSKRDEKDAHASGIDRNGGRRARNAIIGPYIGVTPALLVELAPARVRCIAVALGYNICLAVTGGATPLIAAWLVQPTASEISPALLIMLGAALTTAAMLRIEETASTSLHQPSEFAA